MKIRVKKTAAEQKTTDEYMSELKNLDGSKKDSFLKDLGENGFDSAIKTVFPDAGNMSALKEKIGSMNYVDFLAMFGKKIIS
jgi:hypothetical protein